MKFPSKDEKMLIEQLNFIFQKKHRAKPYDFKKIDDIYEALMYTTAEYLDFLEYYRRIDSIVENLDESIEYFYPAEYMKIYHRDDADNILLHAILATEECHEAINNVLERSENKCINLWKVILSGGPDELFKRLFGEVPTFTEGQKQILFEEELDQIFSESTYDYSVEKNFDSFLKTFKDYLIRHGILQLKTQD